MQLIKNIKNQISRSNLAKDSFWAVFGNVAAKGLSMIAMIIIARILGKNDFGEYGIIKSTLISIGILSSFGLGYTATKFIAQHRINQPELINYIIKVSYHITLSVSGLFFLIVFLFTKQIVNYMFDNPELLYSLRISAVFLLFNSLVITQIGILAGFGDFKTIAKINTIIGIFSITIGIALTYFYSLNGALIALVLIQVLNFYLNHRAINKIRKKLPKKTQNRSLYKEVLKFSFPVALQEAAYSILGWLTGILLIKLSTYSELGLYTAAMQWSAIVLFIPGILRNVILSHLAGALDNEKKHLKILKLILILNLTITLTIAVFVFIFSDLISSFYGSNFDGFKVVLNIVVFTTVFSSLSNVYSQAYMSKNKNWLMLLFRIIRDGTILILAYFLIINNNGIDGASDLALSNLFANLLFLVLMASYYELKIKNNS